MLSILRVDCCWCTFKIVLNSGLDWLWGTPWQCWFTIHVQIGGSSSLPIKGLVTSEPVYRGILDCFSKTYMEAGIRGLYRGVGRTLSFEVIREAKILIFLSFFPFNSWKTISSTIVVRHLPLRWSEVLFLRGDETAHAQGTQEGYYGETGVWICSRLARPNIHVSSWCC